MFDISKKWSLSRIPEHWIYTKGQALKRYNDTIKGSKSDPDKFLKRKHNNQYYYGVSYFLSDSDRYRFTKDLWESYGYKVITYNNVIYVRK